MPVKEISEEMALSQSSVKMRLLRMRGVLKEQLIKEGFEI